MSSGRLSAKASGHSLTWSQFGDAGIGPPWDWEPCALAVNDHYEAQRRDLTQSPSPRQWGPWPTLSSNCHSPNCRLELCFSVPLPVPTCPLDDCWLRSWESFLRTRWKPHFVIQAFANSSFIRKTQLSLIFVYLVLVLSTLKSCCLSPFWFAGRLGKKPTWLLEYLLILLSCVWRRLSSEEFQILSKKEIIILLFKM